MSKLNKESADQYLSKLKSRPDLEPDTSFVNELRLNLRKEVRKKGHFNLFPFKLRIFAATGFTVLLLTVLSISFISSIQKEDSKAETSLSHIANTHDKYFEELLKDHREYKKIYDIVVYSTQKYEPSKVVIFYFEALKTKNHVLLNEYVDSTNTNIRDLLNHYDTIDIHSLVIDEIEQEIDGRFKVNFSYFNKKINDTKHDSFYLSISKDGQKSIIADSIDSTEIVAKTEKVKEEEGDNNFEFKLTEEEKRVYQDYVKNPDTELLRPLNQISIAKIYVQSHIDKNYETLYSLYTTRGDHEKISKEEILNALKSENSTQEQVLEIFSGIQQGEFIQQDDISGYIKYTSPDGNEKYFSMLKEVNGIWKVSFTPIQ